jgi:hypothetical protein
MARARTTHGKMQLTSGWVLNMRLLSFLRVLHDVLKKRPRI